jgi:hypothetical protein
MMRLPKRSRQRSVPASRSLHDVLAQAVPVGGPECPLAAPDPGYAVMANTFIDATNKGYATAIPDVNVTAVDATDPDAPQ